MARLSTTEDGTVKNTYANIVTILKGDPRYVSLRCSTLGNVVELDGKEVEEAPGTASLCEWLRDSYGMDASEVSGKSALYAVAQGRMYSPVVEYLDSVRGKGKGDSVGRLLREGLGITAPTPMQAAMLGRFLISAVARAKAPGCKVDTALILVGEQGAFKSTLFKALFGEWFGDSPIPIGTKDAPINMARVWGYEASEMDDLAKRRSVDSVKQFLASASDLYRPPFARAAILAPRHTVMCGSVNPEGGTGGTAAFLTDSSGSRRFWIITVPAKWIIPKAKIEAMRDEVWADALADYEAGERWWFNRDEDKEREEDAQQYQVEDVWCSALSEWIDGVLGGAENFTTSDALGALGIDVGRRTAKDATRARSVLVRLGWAEKASPAGFRGLRVWRRA
jgi:putative DNA primase/helicase